MANQFNYVTTRFVTPDLTQKLCYMQWGKDWRLVIKENACLPAVVGPIYKSKMELLCDLERFAKEYGF